MSTLANARRPLATAHRLIREGDAAAFRGYLHQLYQTDGFGLAEAGEMLYEYTCKYGADFVKSLPETADANEEALHLVSFLTEHFFPRFAPTAENRRTLQRVYLLYKNLAVAVYEKLQTRESGELAYAACCHYADFQDASTSVGRLSVITARTRGAELMEAMADTFDDRSLYMELVSAYRSIAAYHKASRDLKSARQAQQYARKALELSDKLYRDCPDSDTAPLLAAAQEDMAELLQGSIMHKQAQALYEKALSLRKELAETDPSTQAQLAYGRVCGKLADLHTETKGPDRRDRAIALYETEAEILRSLSADTTPALQEEFARCRLALGDLYADSDKVKDCITAFEHYKAAAALYLRCLNCDPNQNSTANEYAESRYRMALTLWRVGGDNNLNTALAILAELTTQPKDSPASTDLEGRIPFLLYALEEKLWIHHPAQRRHPEFHPLYEHAYGCAEILEVLGYLPPKYRELLSCKERMALRMDALPLYKKHIDPTISLKQQELTATAADWVTEFMKHVR